MSLNQIVFVNLVLVVVGMTISAHYWEKNRYLRFSPVLFTVAGGVFYLMFGPTPLTALFVIKILTSSMAVGFVFYFVVWIQCREWQKKPRDR